MRWDRGGTRPFVIGGSLTPAVKGLLIANVAIFLFQLLSQSLAQVRIERLFGLVPYEVVHHLFLWQLATYMFLHGGFWHIAFNMLVLWMLGTELESLWGTKRFLRFYLISGIWTNDSHEHPKLALHFAAWSFAFLPGFAALFWSRPSRRH